MLNYKKIFKHINNYSWIYIILSYFGISLIFNYQAFWKEIFFDRSIVGGVYGEVQGAEWGLAKFYQALISGHNPFGSTNAMMYPLGVNVGLFDSGYGLLFPIFRPFLSTHQTLSILIALSLILANIGMYLILRKLGIGKLISFILGAAFGYTTFLMPRGGHLSYWSHFIFPWFYYFCLILFIDKNNIKKLISSFGIAIFFIAALLLNLYFFILLILSISLFIIYFFLTKTKFFFQQVKNTWKYLMLVGLLVFIFLIPWLKGFYELAMFDQVPKTTGWSSAIQFSSDLFNYFLPSRYSYLFTHFSFLMEPFTSLLKLYKPDARSIFENFTYPGVIIIFSYFSYIFIFKKQGFVLYYKKSKPFIFVSLVMLVLTLGPFLHVLGHWIIPVDEGIKIVVPLPYIILHYIPFLNNVRVPGRLIIGFIFFAYIVSAYILHYFLVKRTIKTKILVFIFLLVIFFADHLYNFSEPSRNPIAKNLENIYKNIKNDKEFATVLEVPFTVRDGFTYFGNGDAFQMIIGEQIHEKPFLGGYVGRIPDYKKAYYQNNPFLGYIGRLIDEDIQNNPIIDKQDLINWQKIDVENSKKTIDFLDIKYIINNDSIQQTASLSAIFQDLGFEKKMNENQYTLWYRNFQGKEFLDIDMSAANSGILLGMGWYSAEGNFRWVNNKSFVMFKLQNSRKMILHFNAAAFNKEQAMTLYLNKKRIGKINISTNWNDYAMPIAEPFQKGINKLYFIFERSYRPADVLKVQQDLRDISAQFSNIYVR